jgi:LmbE family N-acetylglucosaminyl deacetylase
VREGEENPDRASTVCLLAHPDDEAALAFGILQSRHRGHRVHCLYLTDGTVRGVQPSRRAGESRRALARLGILSGDIHFIGIENGFRDGRLIDVIESCMAAVTRITDPLKVSEILCLAREGGHPDHDATHLIALAVARRKGCERNVHGFFLYNGRGLKGPFFRVAKALPGLAIRPLTGVSLSERMKVARLAFAYPSQWTTWLGLAPEFLAKCFVGRALGGYLCNVEEIHRRPHSGPLFYERRFGITYETFVQKTSPFTRKWLGQDGENA